jgi:protein TonB
VPVPETAEDLAAMQSAMKLSADPNGKWPAGVTPPVLTYGPEAEYPMSGRMKHQVCDVDVKTIVMKVGTTRNAHVVRSCGKDFDTTALKAVKIYRFKPATRDGQPVDSVVTVQVGFTIY